MTLIPEVLAPAGDADSLRAALAAGADAVYFGLDEGFNARLRAHNFSLAELPQTVAAIHRAGARAYVTLNTLVFEPELPAVERMLRGVAAAGVDAIIVQDPAVALLARSICPALELHASTQMTVSSPEAARFAESIGITRVVAPRELSVAEIRRFKAGTPLELEVFIMGALCVSWSGQCLSSEAWGGRSANRGQCAQACRLPYDLIVDDERRDLGDVAYLLSPRDLAGFRAIADLMDVGVHTLKIEGRQKGPTYVHTATSSVRRWVHAVADGASNEGELAHDMRDLSLAYSRGFGDGFLAGSDHQTLVEGRFPRHRGMLLGRVAAVQGRDVVVEPWSEPRRAAQGEVSSPLPALGGSSVAATGPAVAAVEPVAGMGVLFDESRPQEQEQGGPIFAARREGKRWRLTFGQPGPDLARVGTGARVWITSDPALQARVARAVKGGEPEGRIAVALRVSGRDGEPLRVAANDFEVSSAMALQRARRGGLNEAMLRDKLAAFGGTPFAVRSLDCSGLGEGLFVPPSELKRMRREVLERLMERLERGPQREVVVEPQLPRLMAEARRAMSLAVGGAAVSQAQLVPLCRTDDQLTAVIESGALEVVLDWMEMVGLGEATRRARAAGLKVGIATVRVQKPGEESYDRRIQTLAPDSVLVRHWAGVMHFNRAAARPAAVHGDFSLNVTNSLTAAHLFGLGLDTLTVAHDLDRDQLLALLEEVPAERMAVTIHHHIPTFHTEHCVYSNQLSQGRDYRTCGRPCEAHRISLRDRTGQDHPVIVDVGCRNTVFNAAAQSAASLVPTLLERGVRLLRVEFVRESRDEARRVLEAYGALLAGKATPAEVVRRIGVHEQFGVTAGTMQVMR
jgi:putative protease